jgi:hypothetical protein
MLSTVDAITKLKAVSFCKPFSRFPLALQLLRHLVRYFSWRAATAKSRTAEARALAHFMSGKKRREERECLPAQLTQKITLAFFPVADARHARLK